MSNYMIEGLLNPDCFEKATGIYPGTGSPLDNEAEGIKFVGPWTSYPVGMSLAELYGLFFGVASWKITPNVQGCYGTGENAIPRDDSAAFYQNGIIVDVYRGDGIFPWTNPPNTTLNNTGQEGGMDPCRVRSLHLEIPDYSMLVPPGDYYPVEPVIIPDIKWNEVEYVSYFYDFRIQIDPYVRTFNGQFYPQIYAEGGFEPERGFQLFPGTTYKLASFGPKLSEVSFQEVTLEWDQEPEGTFPCGTQQNNLSIGYGLVRFISSDGVSPSDPEDWPDTEFYFINCYLILPSGRQVTIPMVCRHTSIQLQGSVTVEPHKYFTYGGIYDENTGQRV